MASITVAVRVALMGWRHLLVDVWAQVPTLSQSICVVSDDLQRWKELNYASLFACPVLWYDAPLVDDMPTALVCRIMLKSGVGNSNSLRLWHSSLKVFLC